MHFYEDMGRSHARNRLDMNCKWKVLYDRLSQPSPVATAVVVVVFISAFRREFLGSGECGLLMAVDVRVFFRTLSIPDFSVPAGDRRREMAAAIDPRGPIHHAGHTIGPTDSSAARERFARIHSKCECMPRLSQFHASGQKRNYAITSGDLIRRFTFRDGNSFIHYNLEFLSNTPN